MRNFRALVTERSKSDFGFSGLTFKSCSLSQGKVYTQISEKYFVDDDGCSRNIHESIKSGIVEEIY
jgi:hypothetical protein